MCCYILHNNILRWCCCLSLTVLLPPSPAPISCTSAVEENTATIDCTGIDQLPADSNISCTIDGEPTGCKYTSRCFRCIAIPYNLNCGRHYSKIIGVSLSEPHTSVTLPRVEVHMGTYSLCATDYRWQVAHRQYKFNHDDG